MIRERTFSKHLKGVLPTLLSLSVLLQGNSKWLFISPISFKKILLMSQSSKSKFAEAPLIKRETTSKNSLTAFQKLLGAETHFLKLMKLVRSRQLCCHLPTKFQALLLKFLSISKLHITINYRLFARRVINKKIWNKSILMKAF